MNTRESEHVEAIKKFYHHMAENDWMKAREFLDPEIEWIEPKLEGLWFSGRHDGVNSIWREVLEKAGDSVEKVHWKMRKFFAIGDHVVVIGKIHGRGRATQIKLAAPVAHIWTFDDGRAVRLEALHDIDQWKVVMGLTALQSQRLAA